MTQQELPLPSFAIGGYRSFGATIQRIGELSQINLFIGQNNCGKSNILRFVHEIYPRLSGTSLDLQLSTLDRHIPNDAPFVVGTAVSLRSENRTPNFLSYASHPAR